MSKEIKKVLSNLEYGVYVITMGKGKDGNAFTASWVTQVSAEPPMVALAVNNKHQSTRMLNENDSYVIHLLSDNQVDFAKIYYGPAESGYGKLKSKDVKDSPATGTALLDGVAGYLDCKVVNRVACGNHTLYIAEVLDASLEEKVKILTTTSSKLHYSG